MVAEIGQKAAALLLSTMDRLVSRFASVRSQFRQTGGATVDREPHFLDRRHRNPEGRRKILVGPGFVAKRREEQQLLGSAEPDLRRTIMEQRIHPIALPYTRDVPSHADDMRLAKDPLQIPFDRLGITTRRRIPEPAPE